MGDEDNGRKAGTMIWGGLPNLNWVSDIALFFAGRDANGVSVGRS
jgi:hypothetical protein